jgi:formate hydrogenlyase subunit 3/multisubunit Na+/H+ antiporter MnhD subunit
MSLVLILTAAALVAVSGLPGLLATRRSMWGQWVAAVLAGMAAAVGLAGAGRALLSDAAPCAWALPSCLMGGDLTVAVDPLSAFFLVPVFLMGGLGSVYGLGYWRQVDHPSNGRRLRLFWGLLIAGMALLLVARQAMVFLLGWEVMALSAFFVIGTEDHLAEVRRADWLYLIATHLGVLALFAMFALMRVATGSLALRPIGVAEAHLGLLTAIAALALLGFGLKAGVMPLHFWLPSAHAGAPSHVSALLSGVIIKMGIYGLVRIAGLLPLPPVAWGSVLLILGAVSGVLGVVLALAQHDLKRLLAYHSVENIGIIVMGLGLALIGRALGRTDWVVLGLAGCLLHVWNHALFKSLLFLGAGSVVHAVHTREIDRLGGLAKAMPHRVPVPDRRRGDLRLAAAQRVRERAVHLPGPPAHRRIGRRFVLARRRVGRARAGADRGPGGGVLRQGLRRRLPGLGAQRCHGSRPGIAGADAGADGRAGRPVRRGGVLPVYRGPGAGPCRGLLGRPGRRGQPEPGDAGAADDDRGSCGRTPGRYRAQRVGPAVAVARPPMHRDGHLGLRLRASLGPGAIHRLFICGDAGQPVPFRHPAAHAPASNPGAHARPQPLREPRG